MARGRWKRFERRVADEINSQVSQYGCKTETRIPVNGRTGPDIYFSEVGMAVSVKQRLAVPLSYEAPQDGVVLFGDLYAARLHHAFDLFRRLDKEGVTRQTKGGSRVVARWHREILEWCEAQGDSSPFPVLVIAKPATWVRNATFLVHKDVLFSRFISTFKEFA